MPENRKQTYIRGAAILGATMVFVKLVSLFYKIPLMHLLGDTGASHFQVTYQVFAVLLTVSSAGIPIALSRLVSSASSMGRPRQALRYFAVALPFFTVLGIAVSVLMLIFADSLAVLMSDEQAVYGIRVLSPAVLLVCMVSVYGGYGQGRSDMIPTSAAQITEVLGKLVIGLSAAWWLVTNGHGYPAAAAGAVSGVPVGLLFALFILIAHKRKADKTIYSAAIAHRYDTQDGRFETLKSILKVSVPVTLAASFMSIVTLIDTAVVRGRLSVNYPIETVNVFYGAYAKGQTLLVLPSALIVPITISIIPAVTAALANHRERTVRGIMETALKLTNVLTLPLSLGMCVLAYPIFNVVYPGSNENGPACLSVFGIASYFICLQLVTTAILHANGRERDPTLTFLAGGAVLIAVDYILVGNPKIGIAGSAVGTLTCYFLISLLNIFCIIKKVKCRPVLGEAMLKPALCSVVMAVAAKAVYELLLRATAGFIETEYWRMVFCLFAAVFIAAILYILLAIATKTVTREDIKLLPRGERIADFLRM